MNENEDQGTVTAAATEDLCGPSAAAVASAGEAEAEAEAEAVDPCVACKERQSNALLSELALRHQAEDRVRDLIDSALRDQAAREAAETERVDVDALRYKVVALRKNLAAVDLRANERFAARWREKDEEVEMQIAAVRAKLQRALEELAAVRDGEQTRVEAINAAMKLIWAFDRRDRGAPQNAAEAVAELRQILSVGRMPAQ